MIRVVPTFLIATAALCASDQSLAVTIRCEGSLSTNDENKLLDGHRFTSKHDTLILVIDDKQNTIKLYDPKDLRLFDVCDGPKCSIKITDQEVSWRGERQEPLWSLVQSGSVDRIAGTADRSILDKTLRAEGETQHITDMIGIYPSCKTYEQPLPLKKPRF